MFPFQERRIADLKGHFFKAAKVLPYADLGKEGQLNAMTTNTSKRLLDIQAALMAQLTLLAQTSIDQVSVSLEILRHMEFFGDEVFGREESVRAEYDQTGHIIKAYLTASGKQIMGAKDMYGTYSRYVIEAEDCILSPRMRQNVQRMENRILAEGMKYFDLKEELDFFEQRVTNGQSFYDEDQEPTLRGKTPHIALKELCEATIENTEKAIDQHIEYATTLLVKRQIIQKRIMPIMPYAHEEWEDEAFLTYNQANEAIQRIDELSSIHRERSRVLELHLV